MEACVAAGAGAALFEAFKRHSGETRAAAKALLKTLGYSGAGVLLPCVGMRAEQVVRLMVQGGSIDAEVALAGAKLFESLACDAFGIAACFEAGSLRVLSSMFWKHHTNDEVTEAICSALLRLCASSACRAAIIDERFVPWVSWMQWASNNASVPSARAVLDALKL